MFESNTQAKALKVARTISGTPIIANDRNFLPSAKSIACCTQHVVQKIILLPLQLRWMGSIQRVFSMACIKELYPPFAMFLENVFLSHLLELK